MADVTQLRPQKRNANKHTQRGMSALEHSVQADGWIGAITVAADDETFDGSARIETAAVTGFEDAIVVDSDGTRPVVVRRIDIPTADDPRAVRLGLAANRVAELNLDWNVDVLADLGASIDLSTMWDRDELEDILEQATLDRDVDAGLAEPASTQRKLGDTTQQIRPVLYADEIEIFERAIRKANKRNRGEALITVCRAYLEGDDATG